MSGPCCWVFYHRQFNVSIETRICDYFSSYHHHCTNCKPYFFSFFFSMIYSIELQASQQWLFRAVLMAHAHLYCYPSITRYVFVPFSIDLINALFHIMKTNIGSCKHITVSLKNTSMLYNLAHQATPKCWVQETCFLQTMLPPTAFSAYSYTLSACNIYPRQRPSPHREEDAGLWLLISLFSVGFELD